MYTSPASECSSPRTSANRLDLPLPFAPTSPTFWPGCTYIDACSRSTRAPRRSVMSSMRSIYLGRVVVIDRERRMVREPGLHADGGLLRALRDAGRGDLVVDAPTDIALARAAELVPPREAVGIGVGRAEDVDEAVAL